MIKVKWAKEGLWYTRSHKDEEVSHLLRLGTTMYKGMKIYEIIIGKLAIQWVFI